MISRRSGPVQPQTFIDITRVALRYDQVAPCSATKHSFGYIPVVLLIMDELRYCLYVATALLQKHRLHVA